MSIFGYPSSGGGTQVDAGNGLASYNNPDGSITLSVSGPIVVNSSSTNISQAVQLVAGNNITFYQSAGQLTINAQATGGGAISTASYLTVNTESSLSNSRRIAAGNGLTAIDGGAASTWTLGLSSAVTQATLLSLGSASTIFPNGSQLVAGTGITLTPGTNVVTIASTATSSGTVSSVALTAPSIFTVSGSPITAAGTLGLTLASQGAGNQSFMTPVGGGIPAFRAITLADLPSSVGSVQSVALTAPADLTVTGSPITSTGTLAITRNSQPANTVLASPSGGSGVPSYRNLASNDIYSLFTTGYGISLGQSNGLITLTNTGTSNPGTVTSVGLSLPGIFTVSGSPVTGSGTLSATLNSQAQATVLIAPSGAAGTPTFRNLVGTDLPLSAGTGISLAEVGSGLVITNTISSNPGTVTSVGLTVPTIFTTGSSVTTSGNLSFTLNSELQGTILAAPIGSSGTPTFRALAGSDVYPTLTAGTGVTLVQTGSTVTINSTATGGGGGVSSVGLALPSIFSVTNSPVTGTGTLTGTFVTQPSGYGLLGPISGAAAIPTFRPILGQDLGTALVAGSNVTLSLVGSSLTISSTASGGGGGSVTNVSTTGTTSPLFSVSTANQTTAPVITFSLSNAASSQFFMGPSSGAAAAGSYRAVIGSDIYSALQAGNLITLTNLGSTILIATTATNNTGTVTTFSSTPTVGTLFTTSVSNATTTPGQAITLSNVACSLVWAGPQTGAATTPTYRNLAATDFGSNVMDIPHGGTGLSAIPTNGQIDIGNGTGFTRASLTQGNNITITNGPGTITIAAAGSSNTNGTVTSFSATTTNPYFSVSVANPTTLPTLTLTPTTQASATFAAGPTSGAAATPTFRGLIGSDIYSAFQAGSGITLTNLGSTVSITATTTSNGVTSVGLALPSIFTVTNSPVTGTGTLTGAFTTQPANTFLGGASSGTSSPTFRALQGQDLSASLVAGSNVTITPVGNTLVFASTASGGSGGGSLATTVQSASSTLPYTTTYLQELKAPTGAITITLYPAASGVREVFLVRADNSQYPINIACAGSDQIAGYGSTFVMSGSSVVNGVNQSVYGTSIRLTSNGVGVHYAL